VKFSRFAGVASIFLAVVAVLTGLSSFADAQVGVPGSVRVGKIMIACYHPKQHRFTSEIAPARCDLAGLEGEQKEFVSFPLRHLMWSEWGLFRSQGSSGILVGTKTNLRVIAFRRVRRADGRTYYSATNVVNVGTGEYSVVRLPTCRLPASAA
jgi:hypothetical protein